MYTINGISTVEYGLIDPINDFDLPVVSLNNEPMPFAKEDTLTCTLSEQSAEIMRELFGTSISVFSVRLKTKRTPRKMKKAKKKLGKYNSQRTINLPRATVKASFTGLTYQDAQ